MNRKDPPDGQPLTRTEGEGETLGMPEGMGTFIPGQILGNRYRILEMLGRGGMGEVWHAFDLKLRVEVALKALRGDLFKSERRLELLRQEVRAAREVVSPNVCRIFDLIEAEGRELVSMEYVDGATLLGVLQERGPLELKEAQDIASQFLAGLEAIHQAGLVHRDVKPENIMLTRAGRVVLMDFGLARTEDSGAGTVAGTPAYMAPEQAMGGKVDARADVYSAGVVLAEMVSPDGIKNLQSRQSVWEGIRHEPARVPDSPWAPVLKKAVAKEPDNRYNSAHTLTRALEDVTLRVEGAEDLTPYPGLASFTEEDSEYFFGREADVERLWRRLDRPHLLGIVGPSGSGKTSFIRAGLIPSAGPGWAIATCTPGNSALASLRRALASEIADDSAAVGELAAGDADSTLSAYSRWRARHDEALLIVDQFEELFTLNSAKDQREFAELVGRLVLDADVFVLLSMRDDFLMECRDYEPLEPIFSDLTALPTLTGGALRRAIVQPAMKCGYRFEDDELVGEMLSEVEGERGALPLLAFAAARLWEKRDRDNGLLTRQAYHDIGGVGGALARHAEETIDRIGTGRVAIVRELFRNLVTAEGTRAVREWDELLSVFHEGQRHPAEEVLRQLIDARLLTSYDIHEEDQEPTRRVEIIHESLISNWPRLVRWQTQDADAAQLRDQLRQAARTWDEHDRSTDLLWAGMAYREFAVWREHYAGGLSELEENFARAMTAHAKRRKRRRRMAVAAAFAVLVAVLGIVGVSRQQAMAEARRAEAANLLTLGLPELDDYPTAALAYATASLELADTPQSRRFAVEVLWRGPTAYILSGKSPSRDFIRLAFSPDGRWLASSDYTTNVMVQPESGGRPAVLRGHGPAISWRLVRFSPSSDLLMTMTVSQHESHSPELRVWNVPGWTLNRVREFDHRTREMRWMRDGGVLTYSAAEEGWWIQYWPLDGGDPTNLGRWKHTGEGKARMEADPTGEWLGYSRGNAFFVRPLSALEASVGERLVGRHSGVIRWFNFSPDGERAAARDDSSEIRVWSLKPESKTPVRVIAEPNVTHSRFDPSGTRLATNSTPLNMIRIWDIDGPSDVRPLELRRGDVREVTTIEFHPTGRWLAAGHSDSMSLWPLERRYPRTLEGHFESVNHVEFIGSGGFVASASIDGSVRLWPLSEEAGIDVKVLMGQGLTAWGIAGDPAGENLLVSRHTAGVFLAPLGNDRGGPINLWPPSESGAVLMGPVAFSGDGRLAAAGAFYGLADDKMVIVVWELESGRERVLRLRGQTAGDDLDPFEGAVWDLGFTPQGDLLSSGYGGVRRWDLEEGVSETIVETPQGTRKVMDLSRDGRFLLTLEKATMTALDGGSLTLHDLDAGISRAITSHGNQIVCLALDTTGAIVATGDSQGVIRVGSADGSEPHLLFGHGDAVKSISISPDGEWIVSGGQDTTVRLWPMPDLSKPPLHTLPHDELIEKLKTLTNLRVVRDEDSSTGWKLTHDPFPGWETVPTW